MRILRNLHDLNYRDGYLQSFNLKFKIRNLAINGVINLKNSIILDFVVFSGCNEFGQCRMCGDNDVTLGVKIYEILQHSLCYIDGLNLPKLSFLRKFSPNNL